MGASAGAERAHPVLLPAAASAHHRTAAAPRGAHHPGYPTALGCHCCQEESAVRGSCARAPLASSRMVFLWLLSTFPVRATAEKLAVPWVSSQLAGDVAVWKRDAGSCPSRCLRLWQCWGLGHAHGCKLSAQACGGNEHRAATAASGRGPGVSTRQPCSHVCGPLALIWSFLLPEPRLGTALDFPGTYCHFWCWFVSCQSCWC